MVKKSRKKLILFIVIPIIGISIWSSFILLITTPDINGKLISYEAPTNYTLKDLYSDRLDGFYYDATQYYNMPESVVYDILKYPDHYTLYNINTKIQNLTSHSLYSISAQLVGNYNNLWYDSTSIDMADDSSFSIEPKETYMPNLHVVIKTEGLTNSQIEKLIKGVKIDIQYSNFTDKNYNADGTESFSFSFIKRLKTICFDK